MVKHIVMWKVKDGANGLSKQQILDKMKSRLTALVPIIKEIRKMEVGFNFFDSPAAWDIALYTEFDSKDALNTYQVHPDHVALKDFVLSVTESRAVVDYEM